MTHAMVINGVHLSPSGDPIRWKVENSWGPNAGEKGYFVMTDEWFSEYVLPFFFSRDGDVDEVDVMCKIRLSSCHPA
jgi:aminopeptidase C